MTKLKNSNCDKTKTKLKKKTFENSIVTKLKTQIVTKFKNSNCDKTKRKYIFFKTKNKSNCDETQKLKLWLNYNSNCDSSKLIVT